MVAGPASLQARLPAELCLRLERLTSQPENGASDEVNLVKRKLRQRLGRVRTVGESPAFREAMERVSAWYKRRAQVSLFAIALVIAVLINADTFSIAGAWPAMPS